MMRAAQVAYHRNPWIGSAESVVTRRVAGLPWHLEDDNDEEYEEPYPAGVKLAYDLLERPQKAVIDALRSGVGSDGVGYNPGLITRRALISLTSRHIGLCGMAYWYLDKMDTNGIPASILYVNPARVWAAETKAGNVIGWVIDAQDDYGHGGMPFRLDELLPFYLDPPDNGAYGTGLYERALLKAQITDLADQHAAYVLGTGGRLAGIVSPKEGTIPDEQFQVLVREFRNVNEAPDAAKRTTILRGPIDFTQTAASPDDLDLIELSKMNRDDIFAIWGVPPSQAGVPSAGGLNSGETRKYDEAVLMQGAVHDRVVSIEETIQFGLLDRWQDVGLTIDLEIEEPEFDDRSPMFELAKSAIDQPLTVAERREIIGLPPFGEAVIGASGGALDSEVWLPALSTLAYSTSTPNIAPIVAPIPVKAAAPREFLGLRRAVDTRWVPKMRTAVQSVLAQQRSEIAARVRSASAADLVRHRKDAHYWLTPGKEAERLSKVLAPILGTLAETVGKRTDELLAKQAKAGPFSIPSLLRRVGERIVGITDTTNDAVRLAIAQGIDDGLSPSQIGDLIENLPAFNEARAELVARTETMFAYNTAAIESYGSYGVTEVEALDGDEDAECADRNGQVYSIEEAASIEDHPNGTLAWSPIVGKAQEAQMDMTPVVQALMAQVVSADAKAKAIMAEQQSQLDMMSERLARTAEAFASQPASTIHVNVPEQAPPVVNVTTPEIVIPPTVVNVAAPVVNVAPSEVKVLMPPEQAKRVIYDRNGKITGIEPV
jgi:hypothetical protein